METCLELIRAIEVHNYVHTGVKLETRMEKALIACDSISGLLLACGLVIPSKKLGDAKLETLAKKFKDSDYARGADREGIMACENIEIPKEKFLELALTGLKMAASQIGF